MLGFDAGRFPPGAASLLQGVLAVARTGLAAAGDDELTTQDHLQTMASRLLGAHERHSYDPAVPPSSGLCAPPDSQMASRLKLDVLAGGLRVGPAADAHLTQHGKPALRVRSGSCGGVDLMFSDGTYVNAPVRELFAPRSALELVLDGPELVIFDARTRSRTPVTVTPAPAYYRSTTAAGLRMSGIGQLCSDRVGVGLTNGCVYWGPKQARCRFCSIGLNVRTGHEYATKAAEDIVETVAAAIDDPITPAAHVLLGGGTPPGPDAGAYQFALVTRAVKARFPSLSVYVMLAPPTDLGAIDALVESGADEIGINFELSSDAARQSLMPGKHALGRDVWFAALGRAVNLLGPERSLGAVRSILIAGLESAEETLTAVAQLCAAGVMPILTPFRPMVGTEMEEHPRWSGAQLWELTVAATEVADRYGMPLGPTCIPCQANTLNVAGHPAYRSY